MDSVETASFVVWFSIYQTCNAKNANMADTNKDWFVIFIFVICELRVFFIGAGKLK